MKKFDKAFRNIIKEDLDDTRKQQLEKIVAACDQRFRSSKFAVVIGRGNGDYNSPLRVELIHQGIPITMIHWYKDCEGYGKVVVTEEIRNLCSNVEKALKKAGISWVHIEVS